MLVFSLSVMGCEENKTTKLTPIAPSDYKISSATSGGGGGGGGGLSQSDLNKALAPLNERLAKFEKFVDSVGQSTGGGSGSGSPEAGPQLPDATAINLRLAKLEQYTEALEFLQQVYESQPKKPAKDLCAAVEISENIKLGQIEGPVGAPITIVEAWDFA